MKRNERNVADQAFLDRLMEYNGYKKEHCSLSPWLQTTAAVVLIVSVLLSSCAWGATHGRQGSSVGDNIRGISLHRLSLGLHGTLDFRLVSPEEFATYRAPVRWIVAWPHLPSVEETQIKLAKAEMLMSFQKAEEARKALELALDWEAFKKALAFGFMAIGAIVTVCLGFGKIPNSRNRI